MMINNLQTNNSERKQKVAEGLNTILSLFSHVKQQRMFPRNIMTNTTRVQVIVNSAEEMMKRFEEAGYLDCRINAYPTFLNKAEENDYENGVNLDLFAPNILFIDLDEKDFSSKEVLNKIVNKILKHISEILSNSNPLLIWSGRGYHIVIPTQVIEALEHFEEFEEFTNRPSEEFLTFTKKHLSADKADKANTPAFKSCLLRVPYTFNSKCFNECKDPEVKIIQEFDFSKPLPKPDNLLVEFMTFLTDKKLKENLEKERRIKSKNKFLNSKPERSNSIQYVEKLFTIPLEDYRKNAISLILAPYFVNVLCLSNEDSFHRIKQWALKCNDVKLLNPSINDFDIIIKSALRRATVTRVKPLKFKDTLQYKNKELFRLLS